MESAHNVHPDTNNKVIIKYLQNITEVQKHVCNCVKDSIICYSAFHSSAGFSRKSRVEEEKIIVGDKLLD